MRWLWLVCLVGCVPPSTLGLMTDGLEPGRGQHALTAAGGAAAFPNGVLDAKQPSVLGAGAVSWMSGVSDRVALGGAVALVGGPDTGPEPVLQAQVRVQVLPDTVEGGRLQVMAGASALPTLDMGGVHVGLLGGADLGPWARFYGGVRFTPTFYSDGGVGYFDGGVGFGFDPGTHVVTIGVESTTFVSTTEEPMYGGGGLLWVRARFGKED